MYRIFVPLDGSTLAERALPLAHLLARLLGGRLELVRVLEDRPSYGVFQGPAEKSANDAEHELRQLAERFGDGVEVGIQLPRGRSAQALLRLAEDAPDSMIVMSTRGRGGLGRALLGSVADRVARGASCPVLLVRDGAVPPAERLTQLLVALDGSGFAEQSLPLAKLLAQRDGARLHLVRVVAPAQSSAIRFGPSAAYNRNDAARQEERSLLKARRYLGRLVEQLTGRGLRVGGEVQIGDPAEEIAAAAERLHADLILIASHRRGGMQRWALGSVASRLLLQSKIPVVIVPQAIATVAAESDTAAAS